MVPNYSVSPEASLNQKPAFSLPVICLLGVLWMFELSGCAAATPTAMPSVTPSVTPTVKSMVTPGHNLLYALNFENEAAFFGWHVGGPGTDYLWLKNTKDGKYLFEFPSGFLESQDFDFGEAQIAVEFEFLVKTRVEIGLSCRMQPGASGRYVFNIVNDGRWDIRLWNNGETVLAQGWSDVIQPTKNRLAARCIGDQLTLLVNDVELGSARDGTFASGSLSLGYAAETAGAGTFDNLTVEDWGAEQAQSETGGESTPTQAAILEPASPTPAPVAIATLRPTVIPEGELTLYQTEFDEDDPSLADWKTFAYSMDQQDFVTAGYEARMVNGVYRMRALDPIAGVNLRVFSIYDQDLGTGDVDISVQLKNGHMGLVCRSSEAGWYQFLVEPHGIWSIRLAKPDANGQFHFHTISSGLRWGRETLRAECKGDRLTFYIDGEKMASLHDQTFPTGKVGLLGWNFPISGETGIGMQAGDLGMVDNFTVQRAQWNETGLLGPAPTPGAEGTIYRTDFAKLEDLNPYWVKVDIGVEGVPGSPLLVGGPGQAAPHTYQYLNDFDPGTDVEISADVRGAWNFPRGLICRYGEDGWYETFYMKDDTSHARVALVFGQRDEQGKLVRSILDTYYPPTAASQVNLTLTCTGNQVSVKLDGEQVLYTEDNTWLSGRYGFFFTDNQPGNIRNTLLNYTVRPVQSAKVGDVIYAATFDTPEQIAGVLQINLGDNRIHISENALQLAPDHNALHLFAVKKYENSEFHLAAEIQAESGLILHCRSGSPADIGATLRGNGDWNIWGLGQTFANGNSPAIQPGKNLFILSCINDQVSLSANGETLAAVTLPAYQPTSGANGLEVFDFSAPILVNQVRLKALQSGALLASQPLLNQVSIPAYQPDEVIFAWDQDALFYRPGWWGKENRPWNWTAGFDGAHPPQRVDNTILVSSIAERLTNFTYRLDLYNLPIEISAETTLTSQGGAAALFCRATANGRYEFLLQPDGTWFIRRNVNFEYELPKAKHLTILANGTVENFSPEKAQLSATCDGPDLIFSLNGAELGRVQDTLYPDGQVGIFFDAFSEGSFTNLTLKRAK